MLQCQITGLAQADNTNGVLGTGTTTALLVAAAQQWTESYTTAQIQNAYPFGGVQLVTGERQHVDLAVGQVHWDFAHRLNRVGVKHHALGIGHLSHLLHRENGAGFVVGPHHRHHRDLVGQQAGVLVQIQTALVIHLEVMNGVAFGFQEFAQCQYRWVFNHRGDDFLALWLGFQCRQNRSGIGFRTT